MGVCDTEMVEGLGVRMTGPWGPCRTGVPAGTCCAPMMFGSLPSELRSSSLPTTRMEAPRPPLLARLPEVITFGLLWLLFETARELPMLKLMDGTSAGTLPSTTAAFCIMPVSPVFVTLKGEKLKIKGSSNKQGGHSCSRQMSKGYLVIIKSL